MGWESYCIYNDNRRNVAGTLCIPQHCCAQRARSLSYTNGQELRASPTLTVTPHPHPPGTLTLAHSTCAIARNRVTGIFRHTSAGPKGPTLLKRPPADSRVRMVYEHESLHTNTSRAETSLKFGYNVKIVQLIWVLLAAHRGSTPTLIGHIPLPSR